MYTVIGKFLKAPDKTLFFNRKGLIFYLSTKTYLADSLEARHRGASNKFPTRSFFSCVTEIVSFLMAQDKTLFFSTERY